MTTRFQAPIVPPALLKSAVSHPSTSTPWAARASSAPAAPWEHRARVAYIFGQKDPLTNTFRAALPSDYASVIPNVKSDLVRELLTSMALGWYISDTNENQLKDVDNGNGCIDVGSGPFSGFFEAKPGGGGQYLCLDADPAAEADFQTIVQLYVGRAIQFVKGLNSIDPSNIDAVAVPRMINVPWRKFPWFMPESFWSWFIQVGSKWGSVEWDAVTSAVNALKAKNPNVDFKANRGKTRPKWGAQDWNKKLAPLPATGQTGPYPANIPWASDWRDIPLDIFPSLDKWSNNNGNFYLWETGDGTLAGSPDELVTNFKRLKNLKDDAPSFPTEPKPPIYFKPLPTPPVVFYLPGIKFDDKGDWDPSTGVFKPRGTKKPLPGDVLGPDGTVCLNGTVPDPINPGKCITVDELSKRMALANECAQKGQLPDFATGGCKPAEGTSPTPTGCQPPNVVDPYRGDCISPEEQQKRLLAAQACTQNGGDYDVTTGNCVPKKVETPPAEEKKSNTGVVLGVIAALALAGIGIAVAMKKPDTTEPVTG